MKLPSLSCIILSIFVTQTAVSGADSIQVSIDTTKTGAPINPFIYGQFIEHMGRCIYGGIWAEMLEDRKFYFPITADYGPYKDLADSEFPVVGASPWQIIGDAKGVSMVTDAAHVFVGEHVPRLTAGTGIRQRDLGVVAGQAYDGYLLVKPVAGPAEIEVSLVWGDQAADRASTRLKFDGADYNKKTFSFTPAATLPRGATLEIRSISGGVFLGPPSLMPGNHVKGMRRDTIDLLKQLNSTVYRWPGGNFVSGYNWRDGIGDRDRRPPRKNPAWTGVEHNDFGTDEFIVFCREIKTEPMIAANTGFGDDYSAAQWVEYCNSPASTIGGGWRVKNGNAEPYQVKYWCVGNEMFGTWQLGFMQMQHYVQKHNLFADAMWKVDPTLKLTAVGDLTSINKNHDPDQAKSGKTCSHIMLEECANKMSMLSEHFYAGRVPWQKNGRIDPAEHVGLLRNSIREKAVGHRELQAKIPQLKGRLMPITMDEWNYWHREYKYGELGCVYELQDGLGVAAGLHEFYRQSDLIQMAHYAQTVNVIGAIKTTKIAAEMETTGLVLQLYRAHYGTKPLVITKDFAPYDVAAALSEDGGKITVSIVNPTKEAVGMKLDLGDAGNAGNGTCWVISGPNAESHNAPGKPREVDIKKTSDIDSTKPLQVPALSCALFEIPIK